MQKKPNQTPTRDPYQTKPTRDPNQTPCAWPLRQVMPALVGGAPSLPPPPPPPPPPPLPAWRHDAAGFDGGSNCGQLSWPGQRAKCDQAKSQDQRLKELEQKLTQYEVRARRTLVKLGAHVLAACSAHTAQCFPCATRIQTLTCVERVYRRERERARA
jgi:hypothetical protein